MRECQEESLTGFAVKKILQRFPVFGGLESLNWIEWCCHFRYGQSEIKPILCWSLFIFVVLVAVKHLERLLVIHSYRE